MKPFVSFLVASLLVFHVHAQQDSTWFPKLAHKLGFGTDPQKKYEKAKQKGTLEKLSLKDRILILNFALNEVKADSSGEAKVDRVEVNEMIKDVIVTTPEKNVRDLFRMMGTDVKGFRERFRFLPFEHMSLILGYVEPAFRKSEKDSQVFDIPYPAFQAQLSYNIDHQGDNLFQSHYTDFCGKVALTRLWIKYNPKDYARFMTDLYYKGESTWNGMEFHTPETVIHAINHNQITEDPNQKVLYKNPETTEKMPVMMDMVLYLTLASSFHTFPFNMKQYDADKHMENSAWAGAAINPEVSLLRAIGFRVEKVGDNFRGVSDAQFTQIKQDGAPGSDRHVMLLVNSSMLDKISGADTAFIAPRGIEHKSLGTHWITVDYIDENTDTFSFWEYGTYRKVKGIAQMQKIIAGGIIVDGYEPK
ncbi:MAG TPA: hypothetical protein VFU15_05100 [Bacteroidia bacterium]|nr:hypothetical protein [Bacteroidia bacterium]